jgi:hypothetical protein
VLSLLAWLRGCAAVQVIDTGSVLLESACSVDRVHEALAATLPLVPGCQYYRSVYPLLQHCFNEAMHFMKRVLGKSAPSAAMCAVKAGSDLHCSYLRLLPLRIHWPVHGTHMPV